MTNKFAIIIPVSMDEPNEEFYVDLYETNHTVVGLGPYASRSTAEAVKTSWESLDAQPKLETLRVVCNNKLTEFNHG